MSIANLLKKLNSRDTQLFPTINTLTKIIFIALISITATFFVKNILALDQKTITEFTKKQDALTTGNNQESWLNSAASSNSLVGINAIFGKIPEGVLAGNLDTKWSPGGIVGITNKTIASLYNPPISGVQYIAQATNNFLGKPAYAATGFQGLSPLLNIWKGFRNVTYALFSIIFIVIGIMIMLRIKISQQAVVNIQSAIPKLITSLILVTFSYAIVGLLIDLSYLVEGLGISIILSASGETSSIAEIIRDPNVFSRLWGLVPSATLGLLSGMIGLLLGGIGAIIFTPVGGIVIGLASVAIIWLVMGIIIFVYTVKFLIGLIKCYISIILKTVIGPLEIAVGAIPNMKMGFSTWFTDIIANILVFPISIIVLVLIKTLMTATSGQNIWLPPGLDFFNGLAGASGGILPVAFGLGGLMLISKLPTMIPEFIFQIKPSPWGKAIGEGFSSIPVVGSAVKNVSHEAGEKFGEHILGAPAKFKKFAGFDESGFGRAKQKIKDNLTTTSEYDYQGNRTKPGGIFETRTKRKTNQQTAREKAPQNQEPKGSGTSQ